MKKIIWILVAVLGLTVGCSSAPVARSADNPLVAPAMSQPREIMNWIYRNIRYDNIRKTEYTAQSPEQTLALGTGSCYDMSRLLVKLLEDNGWGPASLLGVRLPDGSAHMIVYGGGLGYLDPTNNMRFYRLPAGWTALSKTYK